MRAGLLSVSAASYLTTGRSLSRLDADERDRVLRRVARSTRRRVRPWKP